MSDVSIPLRDKIYQDNIHVFETASKKAKQSGIIFTVFFMGRRQNCRKMES